MAPKPPKKKIPGTRAPSLLPTPSLLPKPTLGTPQVSPTGELGTDIQPTPQAGLAPTNEPAPAPQAQPQAFVPPAQLKRATTFNADGSVTVTTGGRTFKLTKQEHNAYLAAKGSQSQSRGTATDVVQELLNADLESIQRNRIQNELAGIQNRANITSDILAENNATNPEVTQAITDIQETPTTLPENQVPPTQDSSVTSLTAGAGTIAAGTAAGAALGSVVPGIGTAAGALIGGAGAAITKISSDRRQNVKESFANFNTATNNIDAIINRVNAGTMTPVEARIAYQEEIQNILTAESLLKRETDSNIDRFLSGGMDERIKLEAYKRQLPFIQRELELAILQPNPAKVITTAAQDTQEFPI